MTKSCFLWYVFGVAVALGLLASWFGTTEGFMQKSVGAPASGATGIGPYDGAFLPGVASGWLPNESVESAAPTHDAGALMSLVGDSTSPSCCKSSQLSTDSGCVCLTPSQEASFVSRGGNRSLTGE